jgi:hypothetical protein
VRFTVSARGKPNGIPLRTFLVREFARIPLAEIDSVFGFVEHCSLYGGRKFQGPELTPADVSALYAERIGLRLPLTNHYVEPGEYAASIPFLTKYHRPGNAVIVTNDDLARWIRRDFPHYRIEASVIKNIKTHDRIAAALDLYDTVVLPMELNEDDAFLIQTQDKDRITLFANAGCALTCPSRLCYISVSHFNKAGIGQFKCSQPIKARDLRGMVDFDLAYFQDLGFSRFKVLRAQSNGLTGH